MQRSIKNVCKDCEKRHLARHDSCEDYQTALAEWREEQDNIRAAKDLENNWRGFHRKNVQKTIRNTK